MPIYEYRCGTCGNVTDVLVLNPKHAGTVSCRACHGTDLARMLSRVVVHKTEAQRLSGFDARKPPEESFYKDDRNIGLWTKRRMKELGVDVGSSLDEVAEKARSGRILDGA